MSSSTERHVHFHEHRTDDIPFSTVPQQHAHEHVDGDSLTDHAHSSRTDAGGAGVPPAEYDQQKGRAALLAQLEAGAATLFRKTARIVARQVNVPFTVETDRGLMTGAPGDWLVTNHPDDDAGSDVWSISDARMKATYVETVDEADDPWGAYAAELSRMIRRGRELNADERSGAARHRNVALTHMEDAWGQLFMALADDVKGP